MAVLASDVLKVAIDVLNDSGSIRWTVPMLVRFLNAGQRDIVTLRPDANVITGDITLVSGERQSLPTTSCKLIKVIRNVSGTKKAIKFIEQHILDAFNPDWANATQSSTITDYMYDPREQEIFMVYPPAVAGTQVKVSYSVIVSDITVPADGSSITAVTGNISLPDTFANALTDYVLYRSFAMDAEAANQAKATSFYQAYTLALGVESKQSTANAPAANATT